MSLTRRDFISLAFGCIAGSLSTAVNARPASGTGQNTDHGSNEMILTRDDTFRVVFNLRTPVGPNIAVGTGIFVVKGDDQIYMVTANHVAKSCNRTTQVVISDSNGNATLLKLTDFNPALSWRHHAIADVSVLPINMSPTIQPHLSKRFFPFDHFHVERTPVSRDYELTSVGFPHGLGADGMFSPLTYRSHASSAFITLPRFDTHRPSVFFLLENPSVGGYSGCPVFDLGYMIVGAMTTAKDKTRCYGIMHGTVSDETGGKLAAVTPAFYLPELMTDG
ncbi:MAG: trypsin-like peptidase domain-containing protein [Sulfuritalea sp.]|jgi:hypothetical protein|nr:trypsin-like peptidase domain-containing protein [Sulfuritalea sp.]MDP1984182.1 trypsin-like peptidase domain-containing protein [Sulfuritalea sp.]